MRRRAVVGWLLAISSVVVAQSVVHLVLVEQVGSIGSLLDLERSNGLPDLLSTLALVVAASAAAASRGLLCVLAVLLALLAVADLAHIGPHPGSLLGIAVIGLSAACCLLLPVVSRQFPRRARTLTQIGAALLAASFLTNGLDRYDEWFERRRGDVVAEAQVVGKEGLELAGWSVLALGLCDASGYQTARVGGARRTAGARLTRRALGRVLERKSVPEAE